MVHFGEQYLGLMPPGGHSYSVQGTLDGVLEALSWVFIRGKGFGIFSFMFGLSFVLQMQRAERRRPGSDFRPRFAWRLLILFAIGWLHGLAYSGDILTVYAALGIPLILFYRVPDRWLLVLAVLLLVGVPRIAQRVVQGPTTPGERLSLQSRMNADAEEHWPLPSCPRSSASTRPRASGPSGSSSTGSWGGATRRSGCSCSASGPGGAGSSRTSRRTGGSSSVSGGGRGCSPCSSLS